MLDLSCAGKIAIVTGGSRGIGRACARELAAAGAAVSIGFRANADAAAEVVAEIRAAGGRAIATQADIATVDGCTALHAATVAELGAADILINAAGRHDDDVFMLLPDARFATLFEEHVMGAARMARLCGNGMLARRWGRIVNFSSVAARRPGVGQSNYATAKGAVESLTVALAVELARRNVTVNCISPTFVDTDMIAGVNPEPALARQLVKRVARPDEVAAWVMLLVSRYGEMMTGQIIGLDGGYHLT